MCFDYRVTKNSDYVISIWPLPLGHPSSPFLYSIDRRALPITFVSAPCPRQKAFHSTRYNPIPVLPFSSTVYGRSTPKHCGGGGSNPLQSPPLPPEMLATWRPLASLPYSRSDHPLDKACSHQVLVDLMSYCSSPPTVVFVQHARLTEAHVTTQDLRDLLSHSKPIVDEIITLYLELIPTQFDLTYLSTNTFPNLKSQGWRAMQKCFAGYRNRSRRNARPHILIVRRLTHNLEDHNLIPAMQYGLRPDYIILPPVLANNSSYLSGGGLSHHVTMLRDEPTYYHSYRQQGPVSIVQASTSENQWCPSFLPFLRHNHPIKNLISDSSRAKIILCCQQPLDNSLVHITGSRLTSVTTRLLRELISHGQMVKDDVLNVFLEILTTKYQIHYLSTFFIHILQRDKKWDNAKRWFNDPDRRPRSYRPTLQSPIILIPCHVHGNHWVALIRRTQNNKVHFYYSDDMNHPPTEHALRHLLQTSTDKAFYPDNAKWIKCHSLTYRPHSNECGPRTLFALTVLGLHQEPNMHSLMPFMTSNLAQILRTWVASSILSGEVHVPTLPDSIEIIRTDYGHSTPYNLIQWTAQGPSLEGTENATRTRSIKITPPKSTTSEELGKAKLHTPKSTTAQKMKQRLEASYYTQSALSSSTRRRI
jgi:hypothetical protein